MRGGRHIEILVEGRSMKDAVDQVMPRIAPGVSFASHDLGSKSEFMAKAPRRLRGYAHEMAANDRLAVLLLRDRDTEDCDGHHCAGLSKIDLVSKVAPHLDVDANSSRSFAHFRDGVRLLCQDPPITSED